MLYSCVTHVIRKRALTDWAVHLFLISLDFLIILLENLLRYRL